MRRQIREKALQVLFQKDLVDTPLREMYTQLDLPEAWTEDDRSFFFHLTSGVVQRRKEIDRMLASYSERWTVERMAGIDRNIMRIAVYELLCFPETPLKVIINEAVVLGKKFGGEESGKFINGVLGRLADLVMENGREAFVAQQGEDHGNH